MSISNVNNAIKTTNKQKKSPTEIWDFLVNNFSLKKPKTKLGA